MQLFMVFGQNFTWKVVANWRNLWVMRNRNHSLSVTPICWTFWRRQRRLHKNGGLWLTNLTKTSRRIAMVLIVLLFLQRTHLFSWDVLQKIIFSIKWMCTRNRKRVVRKNQQIQLKSTVLSFGIYNLSFFVTNVVNKYKNKYKFWYKYQLIYKCFGRHFVQTLIFCSFRCQDGLLRRCRCNL